MDPATKHAEFLDLFEQQAENIITAAGLLRALVHDFRDARTKAQSIKQVEHEADQITHEIVRRLHTRFVTPLDRHDIYALANRLDDVLDYIWAAAERLVIYRITEPTAACREMADVIGQTVGVLDRAIRCLRQEGRTFHEHAVEVNRLENVADDLLRDSLMRLFDQEPEPIEVIKWKEIYETMELVTDRCEDVANVIEGILLKTPEPPARL